MTLLLDALKIQGERMKVTANLRIEADDMPDQTRGTEMAHKGFKPKTLAVSLMIPYVNKANLRALMSLAEATAGGGQLKTYRVVNDTAAAFGIRQVQFAEGVSAREDDSLARWVVQFTLWEKLSNPERVESRRKANGTTSQSAPGQGVGSGRGSSDGTGTGQGLSGFESVLKRVDEYIGGAT